MSQHKIEWRAYSRRGFLGTRYYVAHWCIGYEFVYSRGGKPRYFSSEGEAMKFAEYLNLPEDERQLLDYAQAYAGFYA
jgi:hypothetical protein